MKTRWRQHEFIIVTAAFVLSMLAAIANLLFRSGSVIETIEQDGNLLLLQVCITAIQYGCYLWVERLIIAKIWSGKSRPPSALALLALISIVQLLFISYVLGPLTNFASYYLTQEIDLRHGRDVLATIFPLHPQPLFNTFGGLSVTLFYAGVFFGYACLRESVIGYLEREGGRREYRIVIVNQVTLFLMLYMLVWVAVMNFSSSPGFGQSTIVLYLLIIPACLAVVMINIYWLFPMLSTMIISKAGFWRRLLAITAAGALPFTFLQRAEIQGRWLFFLGGWLFQLVLLTPLSRAIFHQRKERILALRGLEEALSRSKANLQFLRSQINPHFLFNALNTLYGTALEEGSKRTAQGIQMLGDMMRFMLHENHRETISLTAEIEYLRNYIRLQQLRIQNSDNIIINARFDSDCDLDIAPMLLVPLVENAFKHGISLQHPLWIEINLSCSHQMVDFTVRNSIHKQAATDPEKDKSGIGLKNVAERLKILYPGTHSFQTEVHENEFVASLTLFLTKQSPR